MVEIKLILLRNNKWITVPSIYAEKTQVSVFPLQLDW